MSAVYKKEMNTYFHTLPCYIFMSAFLLCGGLLFSSHNIIGQSTDLQPVWNGLIYMLLVATPVLTMRLMAAERAEKTDILLFTAPVSSWTVTAAKFFSALSVLAIAICLSLLFPLILFMLGDPWWAQILTGYLGVLLFGMLVISVGLFVSTLMKRPLAAGLSTFGIMLFIMLIDTVIPIIGNTLIQTVLLRAAPLSNADYFLNGFINIPSIVYFLSMTALFLFLTTRMMEHAKWSKGRRS
jgi:ABC-2 type transport system permease protein